MDCVYLDAPNELHFDNGLGDQIIIKNTKYDFINNAYVGLYASISEFFLCLCLIKYIFGKKCSWSDAVLWNPHVQMEACYRDFVCVENAKVLSSVSL